MGRRRAARRERGDRFRGRIKTFHAGYERKGMPVDGVDNHGLHGRHAAENQLQRGTGVLSRRGDVSGGIERLPEPKCETEVRIDDNQRGRLLFAIAGASPQRARDLSGSNPFTVRAALIRKAIDPQAPRHFGKGCNAAGNYPIVGVSSPPSKSPANRRPRRLRYRASSCDTEAPCSRF